MSAPELTADQVRKQLVNVRHQAEEHIPRAILPAARKGLELLEKPDNLADVARVGTLGLARVWSWAHAINPFADPPKIATGRDGALAGIASAGDALQKIEDEERELLGRLRALAVRVGKDAVEKLVPILLNVAVLAKAEKPAAAPGEA